YSTTGGLLFSLSTFTGAVQAGPASCIPHLGLCKLNCPHEPGGGPEQEMLLKSFQTSDSSPSKALHNIPETGTIRSVQDPCRGISSQTAGSQARAPCLPGGGDRPTAGHLLPCRLQSVQQHQGFPGAAAPASGSTSRVSIPGLPRSEKG